MGLVQRNDLAGDRRAYRVVLTQRGADLLEHILPHYYQRADEVWESVSAERVSQLTTDLKQIGENAESIGARENQLPHNQPKQEQTGQGRGRKETDK
jgi:hypothetical protein